MNFPPTDTTRVPVFFDRYIHTYTYVSQEIKAEPGTICLGPEVHTHRRINGCGWLPIPPPGAWVVSVIALAEEQTWRKHNILVL